MPLEVEHILPQASGGETIRSNLWLACHRCNQFKSNRSAVVDSESGETVPLFNPRTQDWFEHFRWHPNGIRIIGSTATGRATVEALQFNNDYVAATRTYWVVGGWHPPTLEQLAYR